MITAKVCGILLSITLPRLSSKVTRFRAIAVCISMLAALGCVIGYIFYGQPQEERHYRSLVRGIVRVKCVFDDPIEDMNPTVISDKKTIQALHAKLLAYDEIGLLGGIGFSSPQRQFEYLNQSNNRLPLNIHGREAVFTFHGVSYRVMLESDPEAEVILPLLNEERKLK